MRILAERSSAGKMARHIGPAIILIPALLGVLRLEVEQSGWFDQQFTTALRTLLEIALLLLLLWLAARSIRREETRASSLEVEARSLDRRLSAILGSLTDGFVTVDQNWNITFINDEAAKRDGKTRFQVIGRNLWEAFPDAVGRESYQHLLRAMESAQAWITKYSFRHGKNGTRGVPIRPMTAALQFIRPISPTEKRPKPRQESDRNLQLLADAMPQVVWIADGDGTVQYYNRRVDAFGGSRNGSGGPSNWQAGIHPEDLRLTAESWQRAAMESRPYSQEHRILMADGNYRWHLSRAIPVAEADGEPQKWFGTATDIHELKQVQEAFRASEARLRLALEAANLGTWEIYPIPIRCCGTVERESFLAFQRTKM